MIRESPGGSEKQEASAFAGPVVPGSPRGRWRGWAALSGGWLVCFCFAGVMAPAVNESHYLTKAKKLLDPEWCPGDLFLESAPVQLLFLAVAGGMAQLLSLEAVAWTGRAICWLGMAGAFQYLLNGIGVRGWLVPAMLVLALVLNESCHLAGEWFVGGFEAKAIAWPLLIAAMGAMARGRWALVWSLVAAATAVHFVTGWWGLTCFGIVRGVDLFAKGTVWEGGQTSTVPGQELSGGWQGWQRAAVQFLVGDHGRIRSRGMAVMVFLAICAGLLAGAAPAIFADWGTTVGERQTAAEIQVLVRLPHHLLFGAFPTDRVASFAALLVVWWIAGMRASLTGAARQVWLVTFAAVGIDLVGLGLSALVENRAPGHELSVRLLRLYWFRMADVWVPVSVAVMAGRLLQNWSLSGEKRLRLIAGMVAGLLLAAGAIKGLNLVRDIVPPADRLGIAAQEFEAGRIAAVAANWNRVCDWIRKNTPADALFLAPAQGSSFAWHADRAEWFSWKHAPQDALGLMEWNRRRGLDEQARQYLGRGGSFEVFAASWLRSLTSENGIGYIVVFQRNVDGITLPEWLEPVYPVDASERTGFVVLRVKSGT